ncbi:MAG: hypothetical protein RLZZ136_133 [Pseudomonadota bacterium]
MTIQTAQSSNNQRRLICSIHDVGPRFAREVDILAEQFDRHLGAARFAMLVVPDHWGEAPLSAAPAFQRRLRAWSDAGVEMFVHGWYHRDTAAHSGLARIKAETMTAGEGEFLALDHAEALRRMEAGKALIEDVIGRPTAGFIAPAWLYGAGAHKALAAADFALAEDHFRVWQPATGKVLARGPVITWASRSVPRQLSSRFFAGLARTALAPLPTVRLAVHPGDTGVPALMASISQTIGHFAKRRQAARYSDLYT